MNRLSCGTSCIVACWLLASAGSPAFGQQYAFLPVVGSPKNVKTLFQDSHGRLWLGGLEPACFDGTRFFLLREYGLPAEAHDFSEDSSGAIWIGAETGVYRFANGRVEEVGKGFAVSVIAAQPDVAVAAMGPQGKGLPERTSLVRFRRADKAWIAQTVMSLGSPGPLTPDSTGMLLFPLPGIGWGEMRMADVVRWRPGASVPVIRHAVAHFPGNGSMKVLRDHSGCTWTGAEGGYNYDCGYPTDEASLAEANTRPNLHEGPDGNMVLWGDSIVAVGRPGAFRHASRLNGLPGLADAVSAKDGTIWLGTTQGLYRFASPFRTEYWTIREGLADPPWSIARSGNKVYAGLAGGRIVVLNQDRSRWDTLTVYKGAGFVSGLLGAEDGTLIASLTGGGAVQMAANGRMLARTARIGAFSAMRLAKTADGEIWLGSHRLGRLTRRGSLLNWEEHPLESQQSKNVLAVKYEEHTRRLWACYSGGLIVRDEHGVWKEFTTRDGLAINACWSLAPLPNGDVWYAYYNMPALALIRPGPEGGVTIRQYDSSSGMPEPGGDTLDADPRGWLWRGGDLGVYVADPAEAEAGEWLQLDRSDGLPANGMNTGSVFVDNDGSLWWGADNDLAHYTPPPDLVHPQFAPQVFVSAFSWNNNPPRLAEAVGALPHGAKITAHIGSLQFDRRNALRIRYRVLPEQRTWRETKNLDLPLGSLSTGGHSLEVQGRVFTGPWSGTVTRSFTVLRPVALGWPFLAAYFMAATGLAAGGYLLHRRHQAEHAALLRDVHELTGTSLDARFEVGPLLARGGFANVFSGYDRVQQQRCAVKVFRGEVRDKAWIQRSFEREVAALQRVHHPHVVSIYAHGTAPSGAPYLVMEFVEGRNLRELLEAGPLSPKRTARLLRQLSSALDAIHTEGICHRDVKPENVIIRHEGAPEEESVLIDFSIAIVKDADETLYGLSRAAGSFDYMAPEQAVGYAEPSSDIYSLAKLIIEMLTGRRLKDLLPDAALDLPARARDLLRRLELRLSAESIQMLATALEFDPSRRPRAAGIFAAPLVHDLEA